MIFFFVRKISKYLSKKKKNSKFVEFKNKTVKSKITAEQNTRYISVTFKQKKYLKRFNKISRTRKFMCARCKENPEKTKTNWTNERKILSSKHVRTNEWLTDWLRLTALQYAAASICSIQDTRYATLATQAKWFSNEAFKKRSLCCFWFSRFRVFRFVFVLTKTTTKNNFKKKWKCLKNAYDDDDEWVVFNNDDDETNANN